MKKRPYVLTIAGFDPSSGAGITADIKTFEALKCYGLAVCTANTVQNDTDFEHCHWVVFDVVKEQIAVLFKKFTIDVAKIGIVPNWHFLENIITLLKTHNPTIKIILDPVLTSSTDFDFHIAEGVGAVHDTTTILDRVVAQVHLITPNILEIEKLYPAKGIQETITHMTSATNVLLKGGHRTTSIGKDELYTTDGSMYVLNPKMKHCTPKHGSGCVLSAAIAAQLAMGFPLLKACYRAKRYTEKVLASNTSLLGYHKI